MFSNYSIDTSIFIYIVVFILVVGSIVYIQRRERKVSAGAFFSGKGEHGKTPMLDRFSRNLTKEATEGKIDPIIGRENEIKRIVEILARRTKNNVILVGQAGTGKTALAEGLALRISASRVPEQIKKKKVLALNLGGMLAGTQYRGEFEQRMKVITDEMAAAGRSIILFIDEIHNLSQAGEAQGAIGAANLLKPALARGEIQAVGATTVGEYYRYIAKDSSLERRFQPIMVRESTPEETELILKGLKERYEKYHKVKISDEVIKGIVNLSGKYLLDRHFPDKAIDLFDEASSKVKLREIEKGHENEIPEVTLKDVEDVIFMWSRDIDQLKNAVQILAERNNNSGR